MILTEKCNVRLKLKFTDDYQQLRKLCGIGPFCRFSALISKSKPQPPEHPGTDSMKKHLLESVTTKKLETFPLNYIAALRSGARVNRDREP